MFIAVTDIINLPVGSPTKPKHKKNGIFGGYMENS